MNRNEILWNILSRLPEGPLHDSSEVARIVQCIEKCESRADLETLAGRLKKESLAECDLAVLRKVWAKRNAEVVR